MQSKLLTRNKYKKKKKLFQHFSNIHFRLKHTEGTGNNLAFFRKKTARSGPHNSLMTESCMRGITLVWFLLRLSCSHAQQWRSHSILCLFSLMQQGAVRLLKRCRCLFWCCTVRFWEHTQSACKNACICLFWQGLSLISSLLLHKNF